MTGSLEQGLKVLVVMVVVWCWWWRRWRQQQRWCCTVVSVLESVFVWLVGVLVKAMQNGHWIILDELNLAPSDVLEALNRVSIYSSEF